MRSLPRVAIYLLLTVVLAHVPTWAAEPPPGDLKKPPESRQGEPSPKPSQPPVIAQGMPGSALAPEVPKDIAGFQALQDQIKAVVAKVQPCVVGMQVGPGAGSGVIVSEDGLVMTAGHVVRKSGQNVNFLFPDGKTVKGTTLGAYGTADAGLAKITDPGKWPFVERGRSGTLKPGTWCIAMGHPLGFQRDRPAVVRVGRVLRLNEETIQTDCPIISGDSGGPLLDLDGKIIGIHSRIADAVDQNLHVAVDIFNTHWDRLVKGEVWQMPLPGRNGPEVKMPLRQLITSAKDCVVRVQCDGREAALGTIVGPDGWVLTKASELKGKIVCRLRDGRELEARIVGLHPPCDLAMLKIEATGLPLIAWDTPQPSVGQWVISAGLTDEPLAMGVLSVPRRPIPPTSGSIGVRLGEKEKEARVELVYPQSPAEKAGLKPGDVITHMNGQSVSSSLSLRELLRKYRPGAVARLTVKRGGQILDIAVQLARYIPPQLQSRERLNMAGVGVSRRSDNFPAVLQHDTVLRPTDCGGPVVDLSGKVIGVNIAHAGRTETYCLPADLVLGTLYDLISGRLSPPLVEAAQKAAAEKQAAEQKAAMEKAAAERKAAEAKAADKAAAEKKAAEKAAAEKKAAEAKPALGKPVPEKPAEEKKTPEPKPTPEKPPADKPAAEKAAAEKKPADPKPATERPAPEKQAPQKAEAEKAAAEKAEAEKTAAEKKAKEEKAAAAKKDLQEKKPDPGKPHGFSH